MRLQIVPDPAVTSFFGIGLMLGGLDKLTKLGIGYFIQINIIPYPSFETRKRIDKMAGTPYNTRERGDLIV
jgi:hypothetical protein